MLGLPATDAIDSLTVGDVRKSFVSGDLDVGEFHYMGVDMGITCHITIGYVGRNQELVVVHREKVNYTKLEERRAELKRKYRVVISVHDMYPYTDLVNRITLYDPNAYGAIYVEKKSAEIFTVQDSEANPEEGKLNVRCVKINRNPAFDALMERFKARAIYMKDGEDKEEVVSHLDDMRRVKGFDRNGGMYFQWRKGTGADHYHHSLLYLYIATELRGTAAGFTTGVPMLVSSFKQRPKQ